MYPNLTFAGEELHAHVPVHVRGGRRTQHDDSRPESHPDSEASLVVLHHLVIQPSSAIRSQKKYC